MADDVDLDELAALTDSYSGADLAGLVRQASLQALRESLEVESTSESDIDLSVKKRHFMSALKQLRPSVSTEVIFSFGIEKQWKFHKNIFFSIYRTKSNTNCYG